MKYFDWREYHLGEWGVCWYLPYFAIYTPWLWIQLVFSNKGGFDIEFNNPEEITFHGPKMVLFLDFKPKHIMIDSDDYLYWHSPARPIEWVWEIKDWLRPYLPFISR